MLWERAALGGLVKSWLLAVPGLATLLSDCVPSNPTLEWAEPTFEPPLHPQTCLNPSGTRALGCGLLCGCFRLLDIFFIAKAGQEILRHRISGVSQPRRLILSEKYNCWTGAPSCVTLGGSLPILGSFSLAHSEGDGIGCGKVSNPHVPSQFAKHLQPPPPL